MNPELEAALAEAGRELRQANILDRDHQYRIVRFTPTSVNDAPLAMVCDVDPEMLRSGRLRDVA